MRISMEAGREVPLHSITAWPVGYEVGMGVEIQMLEKSLSNGRNTRNYLQLNTVRQLRAAAPDIYSATSDAHSSCYSLKYNHISVLHMYEGAMHS